MQTIEYRVTYSGELAGPGQAISGDPAEEIVKVRARISRRLPLPRGSRACLRTLA